MTPWKRIWWTSGSCWHWEWNIAISVWSHLKSNRPNRPTGWRRKRLMTRIHPSRLHCDTFAPQKRETVTAVSRWVWAKTMLSTTYPRVANQHWLMHVYFTKCMYKRVLVYYTVNQPVLKDAVVRLRMGSTDRRTNRQTDMWREWGDLITADDLSYYSAARM